MASEAEFCLLGPLVVRCGDVVIPVRRGKQRVLLAALLLNPGRVVPFDELAEALWGAAPPPSARVTVQNYVMRLRKSLEDIGQDRISTLPGGYRISVHDGELDVSRFETLLRSAQASARDGAWDRAANRAGAALVLWRDEPLADVESELLALREAPRLAEMRLQALETRIEADLNLGFHADVVPELRRLVGDHQLREHLHALLMLALYRCDRQAEALAAYQHARQILVKEAGAEPGTRLRELHQRTLAADPALNAPQPLPAAYPEGHRINAGPAELDVARFEALGRDRRPSGPVRQLPVSTRQFAGGARELRTLRGFLDGTAAEVGTVPIAIISGTAGVGKTTLAVHFAYQIADRFPDGQLYVNLRGFDHSGVPVAPAEAIRGFLDALQVPPERIPALPEAQAAMYRSIVADKQMLIVLDNVHDTEQARPLLPPSPGSFVLITSRSQLTALVVAETAHLIILDVFTHNEATEMLASRLGAERVQAEPAATAELVRHCARLPLALALIAARAAARPDFPLAAFAAEFADTRTGLDALDVGEPAGNIRAVFLWSYGRLSKPAARMFRLLGLSQAPDISAAAAASLAGIPLADARGVLEELARMHMLTESRPSRYTFHNLLRSFAAERAREEEKEEERVAALRRMLDYYLRCGHTAALILTPHRAPITLPAAPDRTIAEEPEDRTQALDWFETEHHVLLPAIAAAASAGLDAYAWQISWTLLDFLHWRGYWNDLITTQQAALAATARLGERAGEALAHRSLGRVYNQLGLFHEAEYHLRQALNLHERLGDVAGQARAHLGLGHCMEQQEHYSDALQQAQLALTLHRTASDRAGQADALNAIGWCHTRLHDYENALNCCKRALSLQQELDDRIGEAHTWDTLGYANHHLKWYPEALDCYRSALTIFTELHNSYYQAAVLTHLGDTHLAAGDAETARRVWGRALDILRDLEHPEAADVEAKLHDLAL